MKRIMIGLSIIFLCIHDPMYGGKALISKRTAQDAGTCSAKYNEDPRHEAHQIVIHALERFDQDKNVKAFNVATGLKAQAGQEENNLSILIKDKPILYYAGSYHVKKLVFCILLDDTARIAIINHNQFPR